MLMEKDYFELQSRVDSQASQPYDLQTEIFDLNDQKDDLDSSLKLNRSIIKQMISKSDVFFEKIIENEKLYSKLQSQLKERNDSQIRSLLSEQIAEEAHRREFETVSEYEEKIQELKYFAYRKELFTQELRKKLEVLEEEMEQEKALCKAHVVAPTPEVLDIYNQLQEIKTKISQITKQINLISKHRDTIIDKSDFLQFENDKIKTLLKNPLHRNQLKNKQQIKKFEKPQLRQVERSFGKLFLKQLDQFYKGHQQFSESESENSSSLEEIQFPLKFQKNRAELANSKAKIPQLNLSNVKHEIQPSKNGMAKRLNIQEEQTQKKQKQVHLTPNEQRLEMLLEKLKKRYSDCQEFSYNLDLEAQNIQKQIKHYQNQNIQLASALQNQNRKKVIGNNKDFIKKKVKSKLKRQNSNPLDYVDIVEDHLDQLEKTNIPIFNLNFAKSARPL